MPKYRQLFPGIGEAVARRTVLRKMKNGHDETWGNVAQRVAKGNALLTNNTRIKNKEEHIESEANELESYIAKGALLMSGRHLQHGDEDQINKNQELFTNCFHRDTKILTLEHGPEKIGILEGKRVTVKSKDGIWRNVLVINYGKQDLFKYKFGAKFGGNHSNSPIEVIATKNHRWFLNDGSETTSLDVGDVILHQKREIEMDEEAIAHGIVYGDGSAHKSRNEYDGSLVSQGRQYCSVRLCGDKKELLEYFKEFNVSYPPHADGDPVVYIGRKNWKNLPFTTDESYIAGFIYGWWLADGQKDVPHAPTISTSDEKSIEWLKDYAAYAGYYVSGIRRQERSENDGSYANGSALFTVRLNNYSERKVVSKEEFGHDDVFCVEEPVTTGFYLANGLVTGNCSTSSSSFVLFYLLMNGSGVGRSYDDDLMVVDWSKNMPFIKVVLDESHADFNYQEMESLREAKRKYKNALWFEVDDSREGWGQAVEKLEIMTFQGKYKNNTLVIDFSKVRPSGSPIAGMQGRPASGPKPLMDSFEKIASLKGLSMDNWEQTMWVDHYLSECVLVGGSRRSARISTKSWDDKTVIDYIKVKQGGFLWSANNSVMTDDDFWKQDTEEKKTILQEILKASYYDGTGEPGMINRDKLVQKDDGIEIFKDGKFAESEKYKPSLDAQEYMAIVANKVLSKKYTQITNPCFAPGTIVQTRDGYFSIEELVGKEVEVWDGNQWVMIDNFRVTGENQETLKITLHDGSEIIVTPYHTFYLEDGTKLEARELVVGDRLEISNAPGFNVLEKQKDFNQIEKIEKNGIEEKVYCCTVPTTHKITLGCGISSGQCGEISLNMMSGYCVIADTVPYFTENDDEAEAVMRATTRALIRVNTMDSLYKKEVIRTNRIGVGMTGLHEYAWDRFGYGFRDLIDEEKSKDFWITLSRFKRAIDDEAEKYSSQLGVNVPHTNSTIKPAGTTSKLFGLTEGVHLPSMREYLRWVQFSSTDPLVEDYKKKGYPTKELKSYKGTTIVGFPTQPEICRLGMGSKLVTAAEATPEEQYKWLMLLEKYWINGVDEDGNPLTSNTGNQISYTLKYKPDETDFDLYSKTIREYQSKVRCCSVMPQVDGTAYEYQPEQPVTRDYYNKLVARINGDGIKEDVDFEHVDCGAGGCPIDFTKDDLQITA